MLRVLSRRRDDRVTWEVRQIEVGNAEAVAAGREAERTFTEQRACSATALKVEKSQAPVRIEQFDPTAEQIVLAPRAVGGER